MEIFESQLEQGKKMRDPQLLNYPWKLHLNSIYNPGLVKAVNGEKIRIKKKLVLNSIYHPVDPLSWTVCWSSEHKSLDQGHQTDSIWLKGSELRFKAANKSACSKNKTKS